MRALRLLLLIPVLFFSAGGQAAAPACAAKMDKPQRPKQAALCVQLAQTVRHPSALPLDQYEQALGQFLRNYCHRATDSGWRHDKFLRDTGPYTAQRDKAGEWQGVYHGTHAPVWVWYSPEAADWVIENRPPDETNAPETPPLMPDGAIIIKEMYPAPAARCRDEDPFMLKPTSGAAVMVRDSQASYDGYFWGWIGFDAPDPDWPAPADNRYPYMGFGQYCVNCHASAKNNLTFSSARNLAGEPGQPLSFLIQNWFEHAPAETHHLVKVQDNADGAAPISAAKSDYEAEFLHQFEPPNGRIPLRGNLVEMPSATYDNVWMPAAGPTPHSQYLTSDQCLGCHDAGGTGLQFDMTRPDPHGQKLLNESPYASWATSPMGLAGRDPIFFAQLASETESFHPEFSSLIQDTCLGCHGVMGQRQHAIDSYLETGGCAEFSRSAVEAVPWPNDNPQAGQAHYGALARDGVSCTTCHHMVFGEEADKKYGNAPQNHCVKQRQQQLNAENSGFARSFTGSFLVGEPGEILGPFDDPRPKPMEHALGLSPVHDGDMRSSEVCGSCHTVHLPVLHRGKILRHVYEQTTFPEWAFSAYRTGRSADGKLPYGAGDKAASCQDCHMPSVDDKGQPLLSKIAGIQEYSNFPEAEYNLGPADIDIPVREGFARHTLVGLNLFLIEMARQFGDLLGIRQEDPMLVGKGLNPLNYTARAMREQARNGTASIEVEDIRLRQGRLEADVTVHNKVGHKFPSGVGFRRAFIEFSVYDVDGQRLWASGRTDANGAIVDANGQPLAGEYWWQADCSARLAPGKTQDHQPHFQRITGQNQAQIYQELVRAPAQVDAPLCDDSPAAGDLLTTSFLSICSVAKDNRLLPDGYLSERRRRKIAKAMGAGPELAAEAGAHHVGKDKDYRRGGQDSLRYSVDLSELSSRPDSVEATLYYQAIPPFYLQDRFCTSNSADTERLFYLAGHLKLPDDMSDWKLELVRSGRVSIQ